MGMQMVFRAQPGAGLQTFFAQEFSFLFCFWLTGSVQSLWKPARKTHRWNDDAKKQSQ